MGRVSELREKANHTFSMIKTGSSQKRKYRKKAVFRFIDTLYASGHVPVNWYALNETHIKSVVSYWKKNGLTDDSIRMYLAEIRYFLQEIHHEINDIDNKSLGLIRSTAKAKKPFDDECLQKISDQMIILLVKLQTDFGLTLSESFRFTPDLHFRGKYLLLSRDMTNSSKDRHIQLYCEEQVETIGLSQNIIEINSNPIKQCGYAGLRERYRAEVKKANLTPSVNYRYIFANRRLGFLLTVYSKKEAKKIVMQEMNVSERILRGYINE